MTPAQNALYWREWAAVRRVEPAADRHALHVRALGRDKSHTAFSNADFDKVLGVFRAITQPENLGSQLRQIRMPRTRLLHAIARLADAAYARKIAADKFGTRELESLSDAQLDQLRLTLHSRSRARARENAAPAPALAPAENPEQMEVPF